MTVLMMSSAGGPVNEPTPFAMPLVLMQAEGSEVLGAPAGGGGAAPAGGESTGQPGGAGQAAPGGQPQGGSPFGLLLPLVFGLIIFMMITQLFGGRKEKKKREAMLSSMKKGDRVQTYGGIIGRIVELKTDELVLKVDEGSNTRIRFSRGAVQQVLKSARGGSGDDGVEEVELENERYDEEAGVKA